MGFFEDKLEVSNKDEDALGLAMARKWGLTVSFTPKHPHEWDFAVFDPARWRACTYEQKNSSQRALLVEMVVHQKSGDKPGWFHTSKAMKLAWVHEEKELVYFIDMKRLRTFVTELESNDALNYYDYSDGYLNGNRNKPWKWPSSPHSFGLIEFDDLISEMGDEIKVYDFEKLDLNYETKRPGDS